MVKSHVTPPKARRSAKTPTSAFGVETQLKSLGGKDERCLIPDSQENQVTGYPQGRRCLKTKAWWAQPLAGPAGSRQASKFQSSLADTSDCRKQSALVSRHRKVPGHEENQ